MQNIKIPYLYVKGIKDAWIYVQSDEYKSIPLLNGYNVARTLKT
jgi:hypothetical protein